MLSDAKSYPRPVPPFTASGSRAASTGSPSLPKGRLSPPNAREAINRMLWAEAWAYNNKHWYAIKYEGLPPKTAKRI